MRWLYPRDLQRIEKKLGVKSDLAETKNQNGFYWLRDYDNGISLLNLVTFRD